MKNIKNRIGNLITILILSPIFFASAQTDNAGLILPAKFKATKLIDSLGKARHLIVTPENNIYVRLARPVEGKGTIYLTQSNGRAKVKARFGDFGGTGVYLKNGYLYTSSNSEIFRYKLDSKNQVIDPDHPEKLVTGLVDKGTHETKSIVVDDAGNMYIPIGCPSNSCQMNDREKGSMGMEDCPLLKTSGGVWKFKSDQVNQTYETGVRFATGLRNVVAVDWNKQNNQLYVMQHGRDQLSFIFPKLYTTKQSAELPAECMYALKQGDNAGWPYIYYDPFVKKKILAPEYGGDGTKEGDSKFIDPVAAYPAHMAPNGLLFYTGNQFPEKYKNGAFIAFHGSWNRSPEPQAGYFVVFQPFKDGKPSGDWEVFADNFSGSPENTRSGNAFRRPCGLAQGPDGALYVTDDSKGAIFKITYDEAAKESKSVATNKPSKVAGTSVKEETKKSSKPAGHSGSVAAGQEVYTQNCAVCHQANGKGVPDLNPPLIKTSYVNGDKERLIKIVLNGLSGQEIDGEKYSNAMPSLSYLTDKQIADVLTYVRSNFENKSSAVSEGEVKAVRAKK